MSTAFILVHTSVSSKEDAQRLADAMVEQRLAACCWISGPIHSTYWWQGKIDKSEEWVCQFKTRDDLYTNIEQAIRAMHSYDEPEIVAIPIVMGSQSFLAWVAAETTKQQ